MLKEEMQQTLVSLEWSVQHWDDRSKSYSESLPAHTKGAAAYRARQAAMYRSVAKWFAVQWYKDIAAPEKEPIEGEKLEGELEGEMLSEQFGEEFTE